jgi:hypothetical protein
MAFEVRIDRHWLGGKRVKVNSLVAGFLEAVGDGAAFQAPFADEGLAARFDLLPRRGVDHIAIVVRYFLVQALGGVSEEIAVLGNRAALD